MNDLTKTDAPRECLNVTYAKAKEALDATSSDMNQAEVLS